MATGAAAGHVLGSRAAALAIGPLLHALGDRIPHEEVGSRPFETVSGAAAAVALALRRGPLDAATLGALAASAPDVEHVLPFRMPDGRKLFPSHRFKSWHRGGGLPVVVQLLTAGFLLGLVLSTPARHAAAGRPPRARRGAR